MERVEWEGRSLNSIGGHLRHSNSNISKAKMSMKQTIVAKLPTFMQCLLCYSILLTSSLPFIILLNLLTLLFFLKNIYKGSKANSDINQKSGCL